MTKYPLHKNDTIKAAVTAILLTLFATIRKNKHAVLDAGNTEYMHDYRVAIRRTRCLISQFEAVFHKQDISHFRDEFFWLFGETGKVRDMDVQLVNLQHYKTLLPSSVEADLMRLNDQLWAEQKMAYAEMYEVLDSKRYEKLLSDWQRFLNTAHLIKAKFADSGIFRLADGRIQKKYLAILKLGDGITLDASDEAYHDLRKSCKNLRYLLEFFEKFYDDQEIQALLEVLKHVQDNLGAHQDLSVQIKFLQQLPSSQHPIWNLLVTLLETEKQKQRTEFKRHFEEFSEYKMPSPKN